LPRPVSPFGRGTSWVLVRGGNVLCCAVLLVGLVCGAARKAADALIAAIARRLYEAHSWPGQSLRSSGASPRRAVLSMLAVVETRVLALLASHDSRKLPWHS
jgi:hypothetical protein